MLNTLHVLRRRAGGVAMALLVAVVLPVSSIQAQEAQEALVRVALSEDAAVTMVREQTNGKVLRVDRKLEDGSLVYRIRVLSPDGRLREFRVDAATGSMR